MWNDGLLQCQSSQKNQFPTGKIHVNVASSWRQFGYKTRDFDGGIYTQKRGRQNLMFG